MRPETQCECDNVAMWEIDSLFTRKSQSWFHKRAVCPAEHVQTEFSVSLTVQSVWIRASSLSAKPAARCSVSITSILKFPEIIWPSNWMGGSLNSFCLIEDSLGDDPKGLLFFVSSHLCKLSNTKGQAYKLLSIIAANGHKFSLSFQKSLLVKGFTKWKLN